MNLHTEKQSSKKQRLTPERLNQLLGEFPNKPHLNIKIKKEEKFENYIRKTIEYTIIGSERHEAYLLVPKGITKKAPAILAIHRDNEENGYKYGKSEVCGDKGDKNQKYGIELCERGYIVICPDRFPFESRRKPYQKTNKNDEIKMRVYDYYKDRELDLTEDLYRGYIYNKILLQGYTPLGKELYEMERAIDVLTSLKQVDKNKIGIIGHEIGGILATFIMYLDNRVKVGCSSNGGRLINEAINKERFNPLSGIGSLFIVPKLMNYGDIDDIIADIVPKPFLEVRSDEISDKGQVEKIYGKAKENYINARVPQKFNVIVYNGQDKFKEDMRNKCYHWFDKWLDHSFKR